MFMFRFEYILPTADKSYIGSYLVHNIIPKDLTLNINNFNFVRTRKKS